MLFLLISLGFFQIIFGQLAYMPPLSVTRAYTYQTILPKPGIMVISSGYIDGDTQRQINAIDVYSINNNVIIESFNLSTTDEIVSSNGVNNIVVFVVNTRNYQSIPPVYYLDVATLLFGQFPVSKYNYNGAVALTNYGLIIIYDYTSFYVFDTYVKSATPYSYYTSAGGTGVSVLQTAGLVFFAKNDGYVFIFNANNNQLSWVNPISLTYVYNTVSIEPNFFVMAGNTNSEGMTRDINIYDSKSNSWTTRYLTQPFKIRIMELSFQKTIVFKYYISYDQDTGTADILDLNTLTIKNITCPFIFMDNNEIELTTVSSPTIGLIVTQKFYSPGNPMTDYYGFYNVLTNTWTITQTLNNELYSLKSKVSFLNYLFLFVSDKIKILNFTNSGFSMTNIQYKNPNEIYNYFNIYQKNNVGLIFAIGSTKININQFTFNNSIIISNCTPGTYFNQGICNTCPSSYYCPSFTTQPIICTDGYYCQGGNSVPTPCPAGMFSMKGKSSIDDCFGCPQDFYCPLQPKLIIPCPLGTSDFNSNNDINMDLSNQRVLLSYLYKWIEPINTKVPRYSDGSQCPPCPLTTVGTYKTTGNFETLLGPDGWMQFNFPFTFSMCDSCPVGNYCPQRSPYPVPCPQGTYSITKGNSNMSQCQPCPIGTYNPAVGTGTPDLCYPCSSSFYCPSGTGIQQLCPSNYYCPTPTQAISCPSGTYYPGSGATTVSSCIPCSKGNYCPGNGKGQLSCEAGTFSSTSGASICSACSAGSSCAVGSFQQEPCPLNFYSTSGQDICSQCPSGQRTTKTGSSSCESCPTNKFEGWSCSSDTDKFILICITIGSTISGLLTILKGYKFYTVRSKILIELGLPITIKNLLNAEKAIEEKKSIEMNNIGETDEQPILQADQLRKMQDTIITLQTKIKLLEAN